MKHPPRNDKLKRSHETIRRWFEPLETRNLLHGIGVIESDQDQSEPKPEGDQRPLAIIGGQLADVDAWPWMVSLQNSRGHFCGGALVASDAVLTAAHCIVGESTDDVTAVIGRANLDSVTGESISAIEFIGHPDYDPESDEADIAVILLKTPATTAPIPWVQPDQLQLTEPGVDAVIMGWGTTIEDGNGVTDLRQATVPIVSREQANRPISYDGRVSETMLPAGVFAGGTDTCQGDSGGPLVVTDEAGQYHVGGITSWGRGCGRPNLPGIYTRVTSFDEWIDENVTFDSAGRVRFVQNRFVTPDDATITVKDIDLKDEASVAVKVSALSGDVETVELTGDGTGRFRGSVSLQKSDTVTRENTVLDVLDDDTITVTYLDDDNGMGEAAIVQNTALVIADDHANQSIDSLPLVLPASLQGEIEISGDVDWFQLSVNEGQAYDISVSLNTLDDSELTLFDSDGTTTIAENDDSGIDYGSRLFYVAPSTGIRYVQVSGFGSSIGTYQLNVEEIDTTDDFGDFPSAAHPIVPPVSLDAAIDFPTDVDWFALQPVAGTQYEIKVELDSLGDSTLELIDSDGQTQIAFNDDFADTLGSRLIWTADSDQTRYIVVEAFDDEAGAYRLSVEEFDAVDDHGNNAPFATPIMISETVGGEIEFAGDVDWFAFDAVAGQRLSIRTELESLVDSNLRLFDSNGSLISENDDASFSELASALDWVAPTSGVNYVEVSSIGDGTGTYRLQVEEAAPINAMPISVPARQTGQITESGDLQWYSFEAVNGTTYEIETILNDSLTDSILRLFDANQVSIATDDDGGEDRASKIVWQADFTGTALIQVSGFRENVGSFELHVTSFFDHADSPDQATPIDLESSVSGQIQDNSDVDWFSFQATAGLAYRTQISADVEVEIFDAERQPLAQPTSQLAVFVAPASGPIFISVKGSQNGNLGSYDLFVDVPIGDSNLDGVFNSADLVTIFAAGEFEDLTASNSTWEEGDWNGDGDFDTKDLIAAFQTNSYVNNANRPIRLFGIASSDVEERKR